MNDDKVKIHQIAFNSAMKEKTILVSTFNIKFNYQKDSYQECI